MAAIMESFDAQMMDYHGDGDVQMHTSHETWFQEATMEDDGLHLQGETHSTSTGFEDVEIDMEENPAEISQNPEYEMVDEDGEFDYPVGDVEEDVIVHDVSHPPDPSASSVSDFRPPADPSISFSSQKHASNQQEPSLTLFDSNHLEGGGVDVVDNHSTSPTTVDTESLTHADLLPSESLQISAVEEVAGTSADNENATVSSTDFAEVQVSPELSGGLIQTEQGADDGGDLSITSQVVPPAVESSPLHAESAAVLDHDDLSGAENQAHEVLVNEEINSGSFAEEDPEAPFHEDETGTSLTLHDRNIETEFSRVDAPVDQNESAAALASGDSLESSEAALLDPPPGVLLSFSLADHPEVSLFSQPNHPETSSAVGNPYKLVFGDSPSLYYEPLSALFDALRLNDFITSLYDLSLSELVIDASDLQLTISEDNIFTRETSLYDLHQLHEGSGFSGPLRLRLKSTSPRFIVRYRLLQDQLYRLDLATQDPEEEYTEQVEGHSSVEEQNMMPNPETESTEETYTDELTHVEKPGDDLEHNYDANFEDQEEDAEHDNENTREATLDVVTTEELVVGSAESEGRENKVDPSTEGHEEVGESSTESVEASSLKADSDHVATTVEATLSTQEIEETEEAYDETAGGGGDGVETDSTSQHNAEDSRQTAEDEQRDLLPQDSEEPHVTHESNGFVDDATNSDENYTEHEDEDESHAANTDEWDDTFDDDDDGVLDTTFEEGVEEGPVARESANTLSNKSSKRSIDEVEAESVDEVPLPLDSPGSKRLRMD